VHIIESTADKKRMMTRPPFGPGFTETQAADADMMEVWASSFSDDGSDFCEFRLLSGGSVTTTRRVDGY
jgi:hypothetical protein